MICIDSNLLIHASKAEFDIQLLVQQEVAYASISKIETLGFADLPVRELLLLEQLFAEWEEIPLTPDVIAQAIIFRQQRRMTLGDTIIAATAFLRQAEFWTNNLKDFDWIEGLKLYNPIKSGEAS